jgi:hypothetical protein
MFTASFIAVAILASCSDDGGVTVRPATSTTTTRAPGAKPLPDPAQWLLNVQDLPTGWAVTPRIPKGGVCDGPQLTELATAQGGRSAFRNFDKGAATFGSGAYSFTSEGKAAAFIDSIRTQAHSCESWQYTADTGETGTVTPGDLSFPTLGDETFALHTTIKIGSISAGGDYVFAREGQNVIAVSYGGLFTSTDETERFARLAFARLPAA